MKNHHNHQIVRLIYISALLSVWSMAIVFFYLTQGSSILYLGALLNILIISISLWRPISRAGWVSFLFSTLIYTGTTYSLLGVNPTFLITSVISTAIFLMTTRLSVLFRRQTDILAEAIQNQNFIIEALTVNDKITNLMKWRFAKKALKAELLRCQRYHGELTLILFAFREESQLDQEERLKNEMTMANMLNDVIRTDIDIPFRTNRMGLILPERDLAFSREFAYKIITIMQNDINAHISAGLANFPQDAGSAQQIINRAEEALQVALCTGLHLYMYQSLTEEEEKKHISFQVFSQETQEITKPVTVKSTRSHHEEYEKILRNIQVEVDEWIIWLKGFDQLEDLSNHANNPLANEHILHTEFLFVQPNYLVVKIKTALIFLDDCDQPFPGWVIEKVNSNQHYLMMRPA
jgi:GGDEF domain-containing protein